MRMLALVIGFLLSLESPAHASEEPVNADLRPACTEQAEAFEYFAFVGAINEALRREGTVSIQVEDMTPEKTKRLREIATGVFAGASAFNMWQAIAFKGRAWVIAGPGVTSPGREMASMAVCLMVQLDEDQTLEIFGRPAPGESQP